MQELSEILFPNIVKTRDDILNVYPKRELSGEITRIAPSPTGFFHIGTLYTTLVDEVVSHNPKNKGSLILRIEDTDQKREVEGAVSRFVDVFRRFGIRFDEGPFGERYSDKGDYGPYIQSHRADIYKVFIKDLVSRGLRYPCFMSEDEIQEIREIQEASGMPTGIYGRYSKWRDASIDDIVAELDKGSPYVIRFRSIGEISQKIDINDMIKGKTTQGVNFLDIVIMKQGGLPTYHFAHLIDDHLMQTTIVIRGDEWFASLPLHLQLFDAMGWIPPRYAHVAPLVKEESGSKRKLSKRKDPEASIDYFFEKGYLEEGIIDFLCNIINPEFEGWRRGNKYSDYRDFNFKISKMGHSGALVDIDKLTWVNAQTIKNMDIDKLYDKLSKYLEEYDLEFYREVFSKVDINYNKNILRELSSRLTMLSEYRGFTTYLYSDFSLDSGIIDMLLNSKMKIDNIDIVKKGLYLALDILSANDKDFKSIDELKEVFLPQIKEAGLTNGQALWPLRVALSGESYSPGAFELIYILGREKSIKRVKNLLSLLD